LGDRMARVVFDNPTARNAMSPGMMSDLAQIVERLASTETAVVLLSGAGPRAFCSGGDLRSVAAHLMEPENAAGMCAVMTDVLERMSQLPAVILAAVEGAALGGGAEILTAVDGVVAAKSARIGFIHGTLGVSPGWGGGGRLVRRVGSRRALQILSRARRMTAEEAAHVGMVDAISEDGQAVAAAEAWAEEICRNPTPAVQGAVRLVRAHRDQPDVAGAVERSVFGELWGGPAHKAALQRILKK